jgi:hypothetical protein
LNSPNHPINKFLSDPHITNADPAPETHYNIPSRPPPKSPEHVVHASPMQFAASEQQIPISTTTPEPDQQTLNVVINSEPETQTTHPEQTQIPTSEQCDDIPSDNQEHHIPQSPIHDETINPTSEQFIGPIYKLLTIDELVLPVNFALPILEDLLKQAVNIDDDLEPSSQYPTIDLSKIKIISLKRKKPEPTIPFDKNQPFFNPISEPNL